MKFRAFNPITREIREFGADEVLPDGWIDLGDLPQPQGVPLRQDVISDPAVFRVESVFNTRILTIFLILILVLAGILASR